MEDVEEEEGKDGHEKEEKDGKRGEGEEGGERRRGRREGASFEAAPIIECCYQISRAHRPATPPILLHVHSCSLRLLGTQLDGQWKFNKTPVTESYFSKFLGTFFC